jgi:GR25 family glycosyltransferase involved in LPS biosynthesis
MTTTNEYPEAFLENTNYEVFVKNRNSSIKNINSYVIHYKPNKKRKINIMKQIKENNFKTIFVESYDREELTEKETSLFNTNLVSPREISIFMKHLTALRHAYKNNFPYILIMEDDCLFDNKFSSYLSTYIKQLPENWDMLFLGDAFNFHMSKEDIIAQCMNLDNENKHTNVFKKCLHPTKTQGGGSSKTADCILYSRKCIERILTELDLDNYSICYAYDWFLNYVSRVYNMNVYWCEPTIVKHGSQTNNFNDVSY